jgi:hypothetical protein
MSYDLGSMHRALVIAVALAGGGCRDKELERLDDIRAEVCECKTVSCGEAAMKKIPQQEIKSNRRSQEIAKKMMDCMARLYLSDRPSTNPDAETPAGSVDPGAANPGSAAPAKP